MFNLLISLWSIHLVTVVSPSLPISTSWYSSMASSLVFVGVYMLLMRLTMKKLTALMETAQRDHSGRADGKGSRRSSKAASNMAPGSSISRVKSALRSG